MRSTASAAQNFVAEGGFSTGGFGSTGGRSPTKNPPMKQWQCSSGEDNFRPATLREKVRNLPDDVFHRSLNELPRERVRMVDHETSLIDWATTSIDPNERLHRSPTRNIAKRHVEKGAVPEHLLTGELPDPGRPVTSVDFFKPNKFDRPKTTPPPVQYAHEYRVVRTADPEASSRYRRGIPTKEVPLRIVQHQYQGFQLNKKSPDISHRGVSRNVLGGFYTN
mmetsp:Transcript_20890/g.27476  ORF Transcript_20890/g.27476 Transcript_20890/m.27476 type:complete len:222 (+) Transcript_20890:180-845(+)|eukprot:CAMPEP_0117752946 /NCGR_PEP_ID=MMETSP0947-20121206/11930_1 /TAXON_ID=44440 /ORGANISM="Chattonella subsalsa, Strain CCMP2191" /LENGTH=221 /DNA_ID=CAMNT_0005571729 /DNA_START=126 /DNA_END=791 /DNA_ORIENTATION=-